MIEIAKILKPQGIKGEVKALPLTNVLAVFKSIKNIKIGEKDYEIEHILLRQNFLYIKLKNVNTRNDAETLRNQTIKVDRSYLEKSKQDDEFFIDDLIGMVLYDTNGELVGQIVDVVNYGSCDIFVIEKENRTYEAPYVDDVFMRKGEKLVVDSEKLKEVIV